VRKKAAATEFQHLNEKLNAIIDFKEVEKKK
jgi:hypothetical protein